MKRFGIDISAWQSDYPYAEAKKEGVEFAIIRAGYQETKDKQFETHYKAAKEQGWDVGAYWYSYATTVAKAKAEAKAFLSAIKGKKFEFPVYMDVEDPSIKGLGKEALNDIIEAFGEVIESAGYYFGVYTNVDWFKNKISGSSLNKKFDWWIAQWAKEAPSGIDYGVWQFGGSTNLIRSAKIAGVTTDQNYCMKDYPAIIKEGGFNGYGKPEKEPEKEPEKKPEKEPEKKPATSSIKLSNEPLYASATAKEAAGKVSGTYYYWDSQVVSGRRRITNAKSRIGKAGQVTGWIAVNKTSKPQLKRGSEVNLKNCPLYASSTITAVASKVSGKYYLWDGKPLNGRYRITNSKNRVGVAGQVTGWINIEDI